jgi:hypothetical protein
VVTVNTSVATSINHPQPMKTQIRTQTGSFRKNALHSHLPCLEAFRFTDSQNPPSYVQSIVCSRLKSLPSDTLGKQCPQNDSGS